MTIPWVDPASENDPLGVVGEPGRGEKAASRPSDPALSDKPVLEWTKADWARWIDDSSRAPAAEAEPGDVAEATSDITNDAVGPAVAHAHGTIEMDERPWNREPEFPIVDIGLPDEENAGSSVDPGRLWDEPPEQAVKLEAPTPPEAPSSATARPTPTDPEAHELAPPPLVRPVRSEPLTTWAPPATAASVAVPATDARPVADAAKAPQIATEEFALSRPTSSPTEYSHRVRSALGLLVMAVTVGVVMAGLITVTIFFVGLALRRAIG